MWALAIPGIGLLSLFVFICSFIPIAGCFISTVPIGFTALTEYGFVKVGAPLAALVRAGLHCRSLHSHATPAVFADALARLRVQLGLVIVMVIGIHMIEAYGLNPAIYSAHLKLHPLLVLTVLVVAEHSLGVWGLLLAGAPLSRC